MDFYRSDFMFKHLSEQTQRYKADLDARRRDKTRYPDPQVWQNDLGQALLAGCRPSQFIEQHMQWLFPDWILMRYKDALLWAVDNCTQWPWGTGFWRRPLRAANYDMYYRSIQFMLYDFADCASIDADVADIITGHIPADALAYSRELGVGWCAEVIAYELDRGNNKLEDALHRCISGSDDLPTPDRQMILGIFMSHNAALHEHMGRLLVAAGLQEGLRQVICECADMGTRDAFLTILDVITANNMLRFAGVRRAVGVWTGLPDDESGDGRLSAKALELMRQGITDPSARQTMLHSDDSMALYMALWCQAFYDVNKAADLAAQLISTGGRHRALVCAAFAQNVLTTRQYARLALCAMEVWPQDDAVLAAYHGGLLLAYHNEDGNVLHKDHADTVLRRYFDSPDQAQALLNTLWARYEAMGGRELKFEHMTFPWHSATLSKADLAESICFTSLLLQDPAAQDRALSLIPVLKFERDDYLRAFLRQVDTPAKHAALLSAVADKESMTRQAAVEIALTQTLSDEDIHIIEGYLRYKSSDLREGCLQLLMAQRDDVLMGSVKRLLGDSNPQRRLAGLDLAQQIAGAPKRAALRGPCADLLAQFTPADQTEALIFDKAISALCPADETGDDAPADQGDYQPNIDFIRLDRRYADAYAALFPDSALPALVLGEEPHTGSDMCATCRQARDDLADLQLIIMDNATLPLSRKPGQSDELLGTDRLMPYGVYEKQGVPFPGHELWEGWYVGVNDPARLKRIEALIEAHWGTHHDKAAALLLGQGFQEPVDMQFAGSIMNVCRYLYHLHGGDDAFTLAGLAAAYWTANLASRDQFVTLVRGALHQWELESQLVVWLLSGIQKPTPALDGACYAARIAVQNRIDHENSDARQHGGTSQFRVDIYTRLWAWRLGTITRENLCFYLLSGDSDARDIEGLCGLSVYYRTKGLGQSLATGRNNDHRRSQALRNATSNLLNKGAVDDDTMAFLSQVDEVYTFIMDTILRDEIKRGDTPSRWSHLVGGLCYAPGAEYLASVMAAIGNAPLKREDYYFDVGIGRMDTLSSLLRSCVPGPQDTADTLRAALKKYNVPNKRLPEIALYNPSWAALIGDMLGVQGFDGAVYFFIAHMNERPDVHRAAAIARYSPLSVQELCDGACDMAWFRESWNAVGPDMFDRLYKGAKYMTTGARHSRVRHYVDAMLGRLDAGETEKTIAEKRNKDLLMAYALIPLRDRAEAAGRYAFIQAFIKQSAKFGAQRSASEKRAGEMALVNLAANMGLGDVTRLTMLMESRLSDETLPLFDGVSIDGVSLRLTVGGKEVLVTCEKDGKALKSLPARLKNHADVKPYLDAKKALTDQMRRVRRLLEQAMISGTPFESAEIMALRTSPVLRPMVDALVFAADGDYFGMPCDDGLTDPTGQVRPWADITALTVAHPYALLTANVWRDWQRLIFDRQIRQPFKQIFRELYIVTPDEAQADCSRRYAGCQIQPGKASATLKSRGWVAEEWTGLQKTDYTSGITAFMMAGADWFTPADVEPPAIEGVMFYNRRTGEQVSPGDVPPVVFSEIMRDVDLAVSVAYVGGVDPEASMATIDMRAALLEHILPMFGISNVTLESRHAVISGKRGRYTVHLGSGNVHQVGGTMLMIVPVHGQQKGHLFLPFVDDDPKTAEIMTKVIMLAQDDKLRDPSILSQIRA